MVKADVVLGLQYGDEAKAKCTYTFLENNEYTHVVRFNGGPNAGHTIYHKGKKIVTHQIPIGVFFNLPSIIGPGSVVDLDKLQKEIKEISVFLGKDISNLIQIDFRTHIITDEHKALDFDGSRIGSTKSGIAYAYSDKHKRTGIRYGEISGPYKKIDVLEIFYGHSEDYIILFEGAQGFGLDIDFGDYPFVTSSHCGIAGVISTGIKPEMINQVYGIAKVYETYVGNKEFQNEDPILEAIQKIGQEIGATTGRKRQCNFLNMDMLIRSCRVNQVSGIILNKIDILREVGIFKCYYQGSIISFETEDEFKQWIIDTIQREVEEDLPVVFSDNPYSI